MANRASPAPKSTRKRKSVAHKRATARLKPHQPQKPTRRDVLIKALQCIRPQSAQQLGKRLNLQPHSVRAAISGLRKAGMRIITTKERAGTTYRFADPDLVSADCT